MKYLKRYFNNYFWEDNVVERQSDFWSVLVVFGYVKDFFYIGIKCSYCIKMLNIN